MRLLVWTTSACLCCPGLISAQASKLKPPASTFPEVLTGETQKLEFHLSTPPRNGSLEVQTHTSLNELFRKNRGATILKLRVFAVGSTGLAAVKQIVNDTFVAKKRPLPVLSLVGVAAFPDSGQRVEIESVAVGKKRVNPDGLEFLAGLESPLGNQTISGLARVARESGVAMPSVLRVSCFYESPEEAVDAKSAIAETFPSAESSFVLSYAADPKPVIECEAIARLSTTIPEGVRYFNLPGSKASPYFSRAALVSVPKLIFTDTEMALGDSESDIRAPFERTRKTVEQLGGNLPDVVMGHNYWVTSSARDRNREVRPDYFRQTVPAATGVFFAGLLSPNATEAIELVVAVTNTVTLTVDNPIVDGRMVYKPHLVNFMQSLTKDGIVSQSRKSILDKTVTQRNGVPVLRLLFDPSPGEPDQSFHIEAVFDLKTLALVHREERDGSGKVLIADVDGAHVTGRTQSGRDAESIPFDFTLDTPSYFFPFLDAAVNATALREGEIFKIPTFDFSTRKTEWHTYRVSGRDKVRVQGRKVNAWIIEEDAQVRYTVRKIWLIKEPPYFPLDLMYLPDGSVRRVEQTLVREHS